jgi:hypothetical protein
MVIYGSYIFEFNVSKNMKKKRYNKGGGSRKVAAHVYLTFIVK